MAALTSSTWPVNRQSSRSVGSSPVACSAGSGGFPLSAARLRLVLTRRHAKEGQKVANGASEGWKMPETGAAPGARTRTPSAPASLARHAPWGGTAVAPPATAVVTARACRSRSVDYCWVDGHALKEQWRRPSLLLPLPLRGAPCPDGPTLTAATTQAARSRVESASPSASLTAHPWSPLLFLKTPKLRQPARCLAALDSKHQSHAIPSHAPQQSLSTSDSAQLPPPVVTIETRPKNRPSDAVQPPIDYAAASLAVNEPGAHFSMLHGPLSVCPAAAVFDGIYSSCSKTQELSASWHTLQAQLQYESSAQLWVSVSSETDDSDGRRSCTRPQLRNKNRKVYRSKIFCLRKVTRQVRTKLRCCL
eukprot:GHVT01070408.1.p1 GENE.GHVT01070408.1~~GHVT01070408.1.p1  ORF type:complete len:363 (-),score=35.53 GHVT01070408.1:1396-2484(-)